MIFQNKITKQSNLEENDSISTYDNKWSAQQNHNAFETFFYFLKEVRPSRILEIGTSIGGLTSFLNYACKNLKLECKILSYDINEYPWYSEMLESGIDVRIENIFNDDYSDFKDEVKDFIMSDGITLILCDGGNKKKEFNILSNFMKDGDFILGHDFAQDKDFFENEIKGKFWNWFELSYEDISDACNRNSLVEYRKDVFHKIVWTCHMKDSTNYKIEKPQLTSTVEINETYSGLTFVTGLWDIKRGNLSEGWARGFEHYLTKLDELLKIENNLIIFGEESLEEFVWERRSIENTQFIVRPLEWFKSSVPFESIQNIRQDSTWLSQSGWLPDSTQAKLEYYNPLVMSKMFLLNDAKILDKFNSEYLFWIDAGITNTVHPGYFTHDKIQNKFHKLFDKFTFICFPYLANTEIHGFKYPKINDYAQNNVKMVARGGLFGGPVDSISDINGIYYNLLSKTISDGYMGTEESIFSIMVYRHFDIIDFVEIEENGLISKFCEDLKNDRCVVKNVSGKKINRSNLDTNKVALYVITFNSPKQFQTLIDSMLSYDENFLTKTKKFLLDNSNDVSTFDEYSSICNEYGFEHIKKDNLGICGGRQFIAEHFEETNLDYYLFFEDDMFFFPKNEVCKNGFNRYDKDLFNKSMEIVKKENFDFLKLNFTEFFGDNSIQWSWYNVPQTVREEFWPQKTKLPEIGLDPNAPKAKYESIQSHKGIPYVKGEVYYCNWPQIVSKPGNKTMFLDTKWAYPYEQTWMSHMYQLLKKGELNPGLLLMTPTEHNRFEHYDRELRKES